MGYPGTIREMRFKFVREPGIIKQWERSFDDLLAGLPNVAGLMIENYPTGNHAYAHLMSDFIDRVRQVSPYAVIATLARDVPWTRFPEHVIEKLQEFDLVLVAGPEDFSLFADVFAIDDTNARIKHVGFFVEDVPDESENAGKELLITTGGFFPGRAFFEDALRGLAKSGNALKGKPIRLQVGPVPPENYDGFKTDLLRLAHELDLEITEIHRGLWGDVFRQYMVDAALVILIPGLNNILEAIRAGKPVIAVSSGDTLYEFRERMNHFVRKAYVETQDPAAYVAVAWDDIVKDPKKFAQLIDYAYEHPHPEKKDIYTWDAPRICADVLWTPCMQAVGFAQIRTTLDKSARGQRRQTWPLTNRPMTRWEQIQRDRRESPGHPHL